MALKENYKDDILDVSVNTKRKYRMTENADGTVSFDDETEYTQEGDSFGASDMNATNSKVNTLDANLDGFKFYPTGTELVALVVDDSFYTDENGKYVLADSPTGHTLLADTATYKALASTEDCRGEVGADTATPFKGGLEDIDPNRTRFFAFAYSVYTDPYHPAITRSNYVCKGYKKISVASGALIETNPDYDYAYIEFFDENKNSLSKHRFTRNIAANTYSDWLDIPDGTYYVYIQLRMAASCYSYLSLLA